MVGWSIWISVPSSSMSEIRAWTFSMAKAPWETVTFLSRGIPNWRALSDVNTCSLPPPGSSLPSMTVNSSPDCSFLTVAGLYFCCDGSRYSQVERVSTTWASASITAISTSLGMSEWTGIGGKSRRALKRSQCADSVWGAVSVLARNGSDLSNYPQN